jgi:hypothetical protein
VQISAKYNNKQFIYQFKEYVRQGFNTFDPPYVSRIYKNSKIMFTFAAKI